MSGAEDLGSKVDDAAAGMDMGKATATPTPRERLAELRQMLVDSDGQHAELVRLNLELIMLDVLLDIEKNLAAIARAAAGARDWRGDPGARR